MIVAFVTLGCKVNQVDTEALRQHCEAAGWACVDAANISIDNPPDVLVINSCAVTAESERKTRQKLRHFRALYRDCVLVLTGCAAQVKNRPESAQNFAEADIILGHRDASDLPLHISKFIESKTKHIEISTHYRGESFNTFAGESVDSIRHERTRSQCERTRSHMKIEDGCDQFCAYCIIPHARGRVRSMPLEDMRRSIHSLDMQGFREVVLVGINLAAYGTDLGCDLGDALALFSNLENIRRVRLGSLEPDLLTPALLDKLAYCSKTELCPHFHVSLQSGCDSVLKRMHRQYSTGEYYATVKHLRALFPGAAITTDIIVGFPGESEAEFNTSLAFIREVNFAKIHVFPYSSRPGTPAAAMPGQIPGALKQERAKKMLALAEESRSIFLNSQIGRTLEVLPEEPHPAGGMRGYSAEYTPVRVIDAGSDVKNRIVPVHIKSVAEDYCVGALAH